MTTLEKLKGDEKLGWAFQKGYKDFCISETDKFVKNKFNFSRKEFNSLGSEKVAQLYEIIKDWEFSKSIYPGYFERPLEGYDKSLLDVFLETDNLLDENVRKYVKDVYDANEARTKRMREIDENEFKIPHSKEEQEYNLYNNLLDM